MTQNISRRSNENISENTCRGWKRIIRVRSFNQFTEKFSNGSSFRTPMRSWQISNCNQFLRNIWSLISDFLWRDQIFTSTYSFELSPQNRNQIFTCLQFRIILRRTNIIYLLLCKNENFHETVVPLIYSS